MAIHNFKWVKIYKYVEFNLKYMMISHIQHSFLHHIVMFNPHSAGIEFSRQNLTSTDVRFWRLKSIPAL